MTTPHLVQRIRDRIRYSAGSGADAGFSLIEVITSFAIFAIVAASATVAIYRSINASHLVQQRVGAAAVAQQVIANAIAQANASTAKPEQGKQTILSLGNGSPAAKEDFTVTRTITFDSGDTCSPGTLFTVNVVVQQAQTGLFLARSDTKIACPPA